MPKAIVLPDPVGARPETSRPARASRSVAAWMGKASTIPRDASRLTMSGGAPRDAKVDEDKPFLLAEETRNRRSRQPGRHVAADRPCGRSVPVGDPNAAIEA